MATPSSNFHFGELEGVVSPALIAEVPSGTSSKAMLLDELCWRLRIPEYFGNNWDALEECIRDLSWLSPGPVVVTHADLPLGGDDANLRTYLAILRGAVDKWSRSGERELVVLFPVAVRDRVLSLLQENTIAAAT